MKAFFTIILLAALGGGGYYYFVHQKKTVGDLLGSDNAIIASDSSSAANSKPTKSPSAKPPKPERKTSSAPAAKPAKKSEPPKSEIDQLVEERYPMPTILPLAEITKNWSAVPAKAYPAQVLASEPVPFTLMINGQAAGSTKVPVGTPMKPVQLVGDQLTVASLVNASMQTQIPVEKTNFKQQIEKRYNDFVTYKTNQIADMRSRAKKALLAQPDRLASLRNSGPGDASDDPRFNVVKASIQRGEAHPANLDEATSFKWNGSERVSGEIDGTYDTVTVHFEVSTIFGKFPTDYKCLLQGGKVVGWIDPITQEKITKG
ncbi:MAG: hypothetical protein P1U89_21785 [Verrucomicrobiales bacterium]|nr:hypothetical protein [Verrucomicrobiales bacterium]